MSLKIDSEMKVLHRIGINEGGGGDLSNYYTKAQTDARIQAAKEEAEEYSVERIAVVQDDLDTNYYTITQVDTKFDNFYTKIEMNDILDGVETEIQGLDDTKEDKSNKTTTIGTDSTDTQYPTAKAVHTGLEGIRGQIANMMTTDTVQTVTANKKIKAEVAFNNSNSATMGAIKAATDGNYLDFTAPNGMQIAGGNWYPYQNNVWSLGNNNHYLKSLYSTTVYASTIDTTNITDGDRTMTVADLAAGIANNVKTSGDQEISGLKSFEEVSLTNIYPGPDGETYFNGSYLYYDGTENDYFIAEYHGGAEGVKLNFYEDENYGMAGIGWGVDGRFYVGTGDFDMYDGCLIYDVNNDRMLFNSENSPVWIDTPAINLGEDVLQNTAEFGQSYGAVLPNTTGWTANKTLAMADECCAYIGDHASFAQLTGAQAYKFLRGGAFNGYFAIGGAQMECFYLRLAPFSGTVYWFFAICRSSIAAEGNPVHLFKGKIYNVSATGTGNVSWSIEKDVVLDKLADLTIYNDDENIEELCEGAYVAAYSLNRTGNQITINLTFDIDSDYTYSDDEGLFAIDYNVTPAIGSVYAYYVEDTITPVMHRVEISNINNKLYITNRDGYTPTESCSCTLSITFNVQQPVALTMFGNPFADEEFNPEEQ